MTDKPLAQYKEQIPKPVFALLEKRGFTSLRPCQWKAIEEGLFADANLLVCTPTASGKTLVGELAALHAVLRDKGKAVYVVPLRALAAEKHKQFTKDYPQLSIALASGETDSADAYLARYDIIVATSEKLDSLLRHRAPWISRVKTLIIDEIHLLNDASRGPTLEVVVTLLRRILDVQVVGLSATIGNAEELADWLDAKLVKDAWRPVRLDKGVYLDGRITFWHHGREP
ncbi:DEAD/DEAH box helicase [Candidatus Woesearchaeota archaeon]|nr:MAG: DEAD/DEAH box helicase [Candidatus Woesearchaeota archaeon]